MSEICEHVKENGSRLQISRHVSSRLLLFPLARLHASAPIEDPAYETPALDSEAGVQLVAAQIFRSLAAGKLDPYRAQTMLASINVIAKSLRCNEGWPCNEHIVRELPPAMEKQLAAQFHPNLYRKQKALHRSRKYSTQTGNPCR